MRGDRQIINSKNSLSQNNDDEILSEVKKEILDALSDASFRNIPVSDYFWVEIITTGSVSCQNKDGFCNWGKAKF